MGCDPKGLPDRMVNPSSQLTWWQREQVLWGPRQLGQFFPLGLTDSLGSEEKGQLLITFSRIVGNVRGSPVSPSLKSSKPERDFLGLKLHQESPIILLELERVFFCLFCFFAFEGLWKGGHSLGESQHDECVLR